VVGQGPPGFGLLQMTLMGAGMLAAGAGASYWYKMQLQTSQTAGELEKSRGLVACCEEVPRASTCTV